MTLTSKEGRTEEYFGDGQFSVEQFKEEDRGIKFNTPLVVEYYATKVLVPTWAIGFWWEVDVTLNNGMNYTIRFFDEKWYQYPKLSLSATKEELEENLKKAICFEFIHSFFHPNCDPNYGLLNWAIYGNFKDLVTLKEDEN